MKRAPIPLLLCALHHLLSVCHVSECAAPCSSVLEARLLGNKTSFRFHSQEYLAKNDHMTIFFNYPVSDIESSSLDAEKGSLDEWTLTLPRGEETPPSASTAAPADLSFRAAHGAQPLKVVRVRWNDSFLCAEEETRLECRTEELDLRAERLVESTASWNAGLAHNYRVEIPACPEFVGYALEIVFTTNVNSIQVFTQNVIASQISPTHWTLTKAWTEEAVVKLVKVFMEVSYAEAGDVRAVLLNGRPIIGDGNALVVTGNENISNAMTQDCESFFQERGEPWFASAGEKARALWFSAKVRTRSQVGVVIHLLFEENIQELRMWDMRHEKVEGNHWKLSNDGWIIPDNGTIRFSLAVYHLRHFHVPLIGVKINDEVLCGLGLPTAYHLQGYVLPKVDVESMDKTSILIYGSLTTITLNVLFSTMIFGFILVRKLKQSVTKRRHLCDFPQMDRNQRNINQMHHPIDNNHLESQTEPSHDYLTVNESYISDDTVSTSM